MKAWRPKTPTSLVTVRAEDFTLIEGSFVQTTGEPCPILASTTESREGIMLCDQQHAQSLVDSISTKPQAFALAVLGQECVLSGTDCHPIQLPAKDTHGVHVILKACVHQFGATQIVLANKTGDDIKVAETQLAAITAWKVEMSEEMWASLLIAPAKTCAQILSIKPAEHYGVSPWGRVFRGKEGTCEPANALSFQFHTRIRSASLELLMVRSGKEFSSQV